MREDLTLIFCLLAGFAILFGRSTEPPDLMNAYSAYEAAIERGDMRRAVRYGELALKAAETSILLDRAGIARLEIRIGEAQAKAGNPQRARALYAQALKGLDDDSHKDELATAQAKLRDLDQVIADRSLRGTVGTGPGG